MIRQRELQMILAAEQSLQSIQASMAERKRREVIEDGPLSIDGAGNLVSSLGKTPLDITLDMAVLPTYFACVSETEQDLRAAARLSLVRLANNRDYFGYARRLGAIAGAYVALGKIAAAGVLYRARIVGVVDIPSATMRIQSIVAG